jgi:hypothetical protein
MGRTYTNNSGVANDKLFTGSSHFKVKEIEVFEITTETASSSNHIPFTDSPTVAHCVGTHEHLLDSWVDLDATNCSQFASSNLMLFSLYLSHHHSFP